MSKNKTSSTSVWLSSASSDSDSPPDTAISYCSTDSEKFKFPPLAANLYPPPHQSAACRDSAAHYSSEQLAFVSLFLIDGFWLIFLIIRLVTQPKINVVSGLRSRKCAFGIYTGSLFGEKFQLRLFSILLAAGHESFQTSSHF